MYCKHCNAFNEDSSRFCSSCGAPLTEPEPQPQPQPQPQSQPQTPLQGQYQPPQGQYPPPNYAYGAQPPMEPTRPLTIALPIVALIVSLLSANLIGIVLGAFALVNFNRYSDAVRAGDFASAELYKGKSRRESTAAIIVTVVLFVLAIIAAVVGAVFFGFRVLESGGLDSPLVEFNYGDFTTGPFTDVPAMISSLF